MFQNYLTPAWRNLLRNPVNSIINIAGLAIAIASVILISLFVHDELRYDTFFSKADHLFQVNMTGTDNGVQAITGNTAPAVGPAMLQSFPEIAAYTRVYRPGDIMIGTEQPATAPVYFTEPHVMAVDANFLQLFDYPILAGNAATCLQKPNAVVITHSTAIKYFGTSQAIGKTLRFGTGKKPFEVSAVLADLPRQSSFSFDLLAPIAAYGEVKKRSWNWFWLQVNTYVLLKSNESTDNASISRLEAKFPSMLKQHAFQKQSGSYEEFIKKGNRLGYELMPFTDVHLRAGALGVEARLTTLGNASYIYIFPLIALFIIILACVNFMNLSTAQSEHRAKEVGIRKVLGSLKAALIKQFLTEAMLFSVIATCIALILVVCLIGTFNNITGKTLSFASIFSGYTWILVLALCILTGLLAGIYPAFYLTAFKPVQVLKGLKAQVNAFGGQLIRNGLVVFQFCVSISLIICTLVVYRQLHYIRNKDLGFSKDHMLVVANTDRLKHGETSFRESLLNQPGVVNASISSSIPTRMNFGDSYIPEVTNDDKPLLKEIELSSFMVDENFIPTYQMHILQGRNFSLNSPDSASVIINETAAQMIGWKQPTGQWLGYPGNDQRFKVIGVVKDFNVSSLHEKVAPFAFFYTASKTYNLGHSYTTVHLAPGNPIPYLKALENNWKRFAQDAPFDYSFLDDTCNALYRSETTMGTVFAIFTSLSIFVACLGLFGLSIFTVERRTKEIGVRKILGASAPQLFALLSRDFLRLVTIASLIAFPLSWLMMNDWLQDFAYRVNIGWLVFIVAGAGGLLLALITISWHAIKAARRNPVKSLRVE